MAPDRTPPAPRKRTRAPVHPEEEDLRTIGRRSSTIQARLRKDLVRATRHDGAHDLAGMPVPVSEAWNAYDTNTRTPRAMLRLLDPHAGTHEIRVHGRLRYELRPAAEPAARFTADRIDVVVDRGPGHTTTVQVFVDGKPHTGPHLAIHVIDPDGPFADHPWCPATTT